MGIPKITVYIVSRNYADYLQDAIESVFSQTIKNWELLIIDDGSDDRTKEIMILYKGDERVRLIHTEGIGLPAVCNLALRAAKGKFIIRLDGDDIFDENILLVLGHYLDKHPEAAFVFPDFYLMDEYGEVYGEERRQKVSSKSHLLDVPANGACTLLRKDVLKKIGGYREDLGAQDGFDIWNKITQEHKFANVNLPLFYYRKHQSNLTKNVQHILSARRKIKMDTIISKLDDFRPIIAVVPCRQHFDFCEDVWKQEIHGKSLLQRNIESCMESKIFDHIVVTSDTPEVKEVISLFKDPRLSYFKRKKEETIRSSKLVQTLDKMARILDPEFKGTTVVMYVQTPFVNTTTLEESISTLIMNKSDCALGVEEIRSALYKRMPYGLQAVNPPKHLSTDFDTVYLESNTSLATRNQNFKTGSLTGPVVVNHIVSREESFFIDSQMDLEIARKMYDYKVN